MKALKMPQRSLLILLSSSLLFGCAHQLELFPRDGGKAGSGTAQEAGKQISIYLDGVEYKGTYTFDGGSTILTNSYGHATAYSGARTANVYGNSISTSYIPGSGQGRLFAHSIDGKGLRCEFSYKNLSGIGICEDNENKQYDLVIH